MDLVFVLVVGRVDLDDGGFLGLLGLGHDPLHVVHRLVEVVPTCRLCLQVADDGVAWVGDDKHRPDARCCVRERDVEGRPVVAGGADVPFGVDRLGGGKVGLWGGSVEDMAGAEAPCAGTRVVPGCVDPFGKGGVDGELDPVEKPGVGACHAGRLGVACCGKIGDKGLAGAVGGLAGLGGVGGGFQLGDRGRIRVLQVEVFVVFAVVADGRDRGRLDGKTLAPDPDAGSVHASRTRE